MSRLISDSSFSNPLYVDHKKRKGERSEVKIRLTDRFTITKEGALDLSPESIPQPGIGPMGPEGPIGPVGATGPKGDPGERGPAGERGPDGAVGPVGPQGPVGERGLKGDTGPQGPVGPKGETGEIGATGERGPAGPTGPQGPQGPEGRQGPQGEPGPAGAPGLDGVEGPRGPQGDVGPVGPAGPVGPIGPKGEQGDEGRAGPIGPQGPEGKVGPIGPMGPVGPQGPVGPEGPKGDRGERGEKGEKGDPGDFGVVKEVTKLAPSQLFVQNGNENYNFVELHERPAFADGLKERLVSEVTGFRDFTFKGLGDGLIEQQLMTQNVIFPYEDAKILDLSCRVFCVDERNDYQSWQMPTISERYHLKETTEGGKHFCKLTIICSTELPKDVNVKCRVFFKVRVAEVVA